MSGATPDHLPLGLAAARITRSVAVTAGLLARRRLRRRFDWVGTPLDFDGTVGRVYRETVAVRPPARDPCTVVVEFRLRGIHGWAHRMFRWESLLNTPLFAGFPGFVSKLWIGHDQREVYRGVYEWDGPDRAEQYVRALWWLLAPVCVRGSIRHRVLPGVERDGWLVQAGHRASPEVRGSGRRESTGRGAARMVIDSMAGAALIVVHVCARPLRRWRSTWGATAAEAASSFPGDDLVPAAAWTYTHAITVPASPEELWPWIVQIGQGRGGFYSYTGLENLVGCRIENATDVLDRFQDLSVGDPVRLHPQTAPLTVAVIEPRHTLVLLGAAPDSPNAALWAFHLRDDGHGGTRLIERGRYAHGGRWQDRLAFGPALLEPISFVMSRKMLRAIRTRVG